jgi:phenylpropionate dioxygenase-like ring-hydroxylating dioxygenase large terminal subunit
MFINFWYAAERSENVTDKPVKVRMLGQDFVLFREADGTARCLSDTCVHRGGSLGLGKLRNGLVECPYHGWRFNGAGRCQRIPSLGAGANVPARARVDSYPTVERYDLVFTFLGDLPEQERPGILEVKEWGQPGWTCLPFTFEWPVNVTRSVENSLDAPHVEFVHNFGNPDGAGAFKLNPLQSYVEDRGPWGTVHITVTKQIWVEHGHQGLSHTWTFINFSPQVDAPGFHFYTYITPVDEGHVRRFLVHARNVQLGEKMDKYILETNGKAEGEDRQVVGDLRPQFSPGDTTHEFLVEDDGIMARYRQRLREWEAMGWKIDLDRVQATAKSTAYAIPGPGRRLSKGWVLDPIPLVAPAGAAADAATQEGYG